MKKVSVIVLTYNLETYIRECLDSIICQKVDFDYEFAALTGTTAIDGITQEYYGGGNDTAFVHLGFIDDAWKIIKVDMNCIDYGK